MILDINQTQNENFQVPEGSGHPHGRYKLMFLAHENPNLIDFSWSVRQYHFFCFDEYKGPFYEDRCFR